MHSVERGSGLFKEPRPKALPPAGVTPSPSAREHPASSHVGGPGARGQEQRFPGKSQRRAWGTGVPEVLVQLRLLPAEIPHAAPAPWLYCWGGWGVTGSAR